MSRTSESTWRTRASRFPGVLVAGITAMISGVSVFVNSFGVHAVTSPAVYTTAKNLVATLVLMFAAAVGWWARRRFAATAPANFVSVAPRDDDGPSARAGARERGSSTWTIARWLSVTYVGVIGGGLAFVLFFQGLSQSPPASAAFWRDTLVVWVAVLAIPLLHERIRWWNVLAVVLLVTGEITVSGGVGQLAANRGELDVLAATVLWAGEVVIAKRMLRDVSPAVLSLVRMGVGGVALVAYLAVTGSLGSLVSLNTHQVMWAVWSGLLLAAYVATWMTALARARALDVTSVLVASALVTWLLQLLDGSATPAPTSLGLVLIGAGAGVVVWAGTNRPAAERRSVLGP